jgi:glycolate oxidase iron-sulfur subunit
VISLREETKKCFKCGMCRSVCPVLQAELTEDSSPRGKVALCEALSEERIIASARLLSLLEKCTGCRSCSQNCTSGTDPRSMTLLARSDSDLSEDWSHARGPVADTLLRLAGARSKELAHLTPAGTSGSRVAYFIGCVEAERFEEAVSNVIRIFDALGIEIAVPAKQVCCGWPQLMKADIEGAKELARENSEVFEGFDTILTTCPHCRSVLVDDYHSLIGVSAFRGRTRDALRFLLEKGLAKRLALASAASGVSYSQPCRMGRGKARDALYADFLRGMLGAAAVLGESDECCGAPLQLTSPALAERMLARKMGEIDDSSISMILSNCPFCLLGMEPVSRVAVRHLFEEITLRP